MPDFAPRTKEKGKGSKPKELDMLRFFIVKFLVITPLLFILAGCAELPGDRKTQGAVIGGAAGAAAGAAVGGKDHRVLGALLGGVLGAGGGYVIAARTDKVDSKDRDGAVRASRTAETNPATPEQAMTATTADVNGDGFVTLDEVVAMKEAGLSDEVMLQRLRATDQIFELTAEQQQHLIQKGVSQQVVDEMARINQPVLAPETRRTDVIGEPAIR
jgi:hypothetical protein